jgi:cellulose synthase/poly-beta-1,6-N-acetylglucosamine synthase-like glycosyltransferase
MSTFAEIVIVVQFLFFGYFILLNGTYLVLNFISAFRLWRVMQEREMEGVLRPYSGLEPRISLLVPAHNEESTVATNVMSLLQLDYPDYEIIVVNDGSGDKTMDVLKSEFSLVPFPESNPQIINTQPVLATYHSTKYPRLRVVDKENGGKADALNAALNIATSPLFCSIDADSILQRDSLQILVRPFLDDATTVASGGTVRVANGCDVRNGYLVRPGLPKSWLANLQIVEYLRAFLFGRLGWAPMNGILVVSGAVGLFDKSRVLEAGGYRTDTVGEDMELVVRLHRYHRDHEIPYRIAFLANPTCWTEAPEDMKTLRSQRIRWQRGLCESLLANRGLIMSSGSGAAGWLALPFTILFEMLGPFIELLGYVFMIVLAILGFVSLNTFLIFVMLAVGLGVLLSVTSILLEEMSFHIYPKPSQILALFLIAFVDNLGYRQTMALWRLWGFFSWLFGSKGKWGKMSRKGTWNQTFEEKGERRNRPDRRTSPAIS